MSNTEGDLNKLLITILCLTSIFLSFFFVLILNKKQSNYARIVRHIVMSEGIYIFCFLGMVLHNEIKENMIEKLKTNCTDIFNFLTFNLFKTDQNIDKEDKSITSNKSIENLINLFNISAYYAMETFSLLLSIFICLELILILKNPISQMKSRLKPYFIISTFLAIIVFVMICTLDPSHLKAENIEDFLFIQDFQIKFSRYISLVLYIIFLGVGFISIFFLFLRFCNGKTLLQNFRNLFVIRHFLYVITYSIALGPLKLFIFLKLLNLNNSSYLDLNFCLYTNISVGIIMFFIRSSETKFYQMLFCYFCRKNKNKGSNYFIDIPLTSIISRNMNLEFMCCILYGLSDIFEKDEAKSRSKTLMYEDCNIEIIEKSKSTSSLLFLEKSNSKEKSLLSQGIGKKDFKRAKKHQIIYKKIFNDTIDFENLEVEVNSVKKSKKNNISLGGSSETESEKNETDENKKKNHDALVIEYCPKVFRELRKLDEYSAGELDNSLNPLMNKDRMTKIKESEGKSGSFFFFSHDGRFLIKTISNNELNTMIGKFMESYYEYMTNNPDSLIARVYGIYTIIIKGVSKINLILMENLMVIDKITIKRIFDLKGSRVERKTKNIEKCDNLKTLKDLDFLWMTKVEEDLISFTTDQTDILIGQLAQDVAILRELFVMDYSLLLIIVHFPKAEDPNYENIINLFGDRRCCRRIFKSENKRYIYILGIIDYLQKFNVAKFLENKYKSILYGDEIRYVSAVDPTIYSERMFEFAKDFIFVTASQ